MRTRNVAKRSPRYVSAPLPVVALTAALMAAAAGCSAPASPGRAESVVAPSAPASTSAAASPAAAEPARATFELDGKVGSVVSQHPDWHAVRLTLSGYRPTSRVTCQVRSTEADLVSWSGTFDVDSSGHWGPARLTPKNSTGTLVVAAATDLPGTGDCHQQ